ncbi:MAG TPA: hypothetical protein VF008_28330 [Niastella sp.]
MKKTLNNTWLPIAFCLLIFASCQKNVDTTPAGSNSESLTSTLSTASIAVEDCLAITDSVTGTGTGHSYANWTPSTKALGAGPTLQYEGQYISFIRPATASWYIGTISNSAACSDWDELIDVISVKNALANVGTAPANPYNVVGYRNATYGLGYYFYSSTVPTVDRTIVIWKDVNSTSDSYVSNPADATEAYVLQVQSINPGGAIPSLTSKIVYKYHKVL